MSAQIDGDPKPARFQISYSLAILWKINVWKFEFYGANFGILRNVLILQPGGFVQPFVPKGIISKLFFSPPSQNESDSVCLILKKIRGWTGGRGGEGG